MEFSIDFSEDAERHFSQFSARDRAMLLDEIQQQLTYEPDVPTRHRKLLRQNPLAAWQLRVGDSRVFYNVERDRHLVIIVAIGEKRHNVLTIDGKVYSL